MPWTRAAAVRPSGRWGDRSARCSSPRRVAGSAGRFLLERMGEGVVRQLRLGPVDRPLRLGMRAYDRHRAGDLVSRVTADTTPLREVASQALAWPTW
ncbi:ABC transporter transmembrane domain-containing protein [Streptomyces griseoloalbus]|uniref:ABC-type multidrug transport system fused ATPase/permease subunit n=1 Tax=Streptomyces griseoloalbus TaxID=67303 RepID=A0A7W8BPL8_9ACTN|nr:ABC transporter transmembrane domain-containing protein [Streptomyces albaduncus]MBB5126161.1 ABC-type multidrug transport system fused ATPase/permease subunit [Streptomyces albaduncus]